AVGFFCLLLLVVEKSDDQQKENYCAVGPSFNIIPTVHQSSVTPLYESGSTPKKIQHDSLVAFAIRIPSLYLLPEGIIQNILVLCDFAFSTESGTVCMYESSWYNSGQLESDQITPASDITPLVDSDEGSAGIQTDYARGDHVHSQQLTYDNDLTATKFIKTNGTVSQILCANGDTTTDIVTKTTDQTITGIKPIN
ncbi:MAG: hypothetical protein EZS28_043267, partial [Streblomastix strix]